MKPYRLIATTVDGQEIEIDDVCILRVDLAEDGKYDISMSVGLKNKFLITTGIEPQGIEV